jgi:hypothetical protein
MIHLKKTNNQNTMKPFDIEKAKSGHPVCNRDGQDVRIICYDKVGDFPIVALHKFSDGSENACDHCLNGKVTDSKHKYMGDLFMKPIKVTKWINIYHKGKNDFVFYGFYDTEEEAKEGAADDVIRTVKVEWEEE